MVQTSETVRPAGITSKSIVRKSAILALALGIGVLISSPLAHAQDINRNRVGDCNQGGDPPSVPEPSALLQLGAGISALAIVSRKQLLSRKA
jgi:hypothetical protein